MKKLIGLFLVFLSFSVTAQDLQEYLMETRVIAKDGKYAEALQRYIWFHDHALEVNSAYAGVRLSFALFDWKHLGSIYEPAMTAMIAIRDRKINQLIDSAGTAELFGDIVALNRTLEDESRNLTLFETVEKKRPTIAFKCWFFARDLLFAERRYDIIRHYITDPLKEYENVKSSFVHDTAMLSQIPNRTVYLDAFYHNRFIENTLQLIVLSLDNKDEKTAIAIREMAILVIDDKRIREAVRAN